MKYIAKCSVTYTVEETVEASSPEEAESLASKMWSEGTIDPYAHGESDTSIEIVPVK